MGNRNQLRERANPLGGIQAQDIMNRMIGDAAAEPEIIEREVVVYQSDPNALIPQGAGVYVYKRFVMTPTGMQMPEDVTADELIEVGHIVKGLESSIQWIVGDLMNAIQRVWGDSYQQVAESLGYEVKTVYEWAYVCRKVSIRMEKPLRFGHHQIVAQLPPDQQEYWLMQAFQGGWSISQMKKLMRGTSPTLSKVTAGREEKQAEKYTQYVQNELPNLEQMDVQRRAAVAERAEWLAQYYEGVARRARGA